MWHDFKGLGGKIATEGYYTPNVSALRVLVYELFLEILLLKNDKITIFLIIFYIFHENNVKKLF